jgi:2',3'-cyclic-nucleotide 2'-phosphodiesterase / 3'-nucleotidase
LSRVSTLLKQQKDPFLYVDNGDILQGSALMDQSRRLSQTNPAATALNLLGCLYYTLGNHDFNYGLPYLDAYIQQMKGTLLLANVIKEDKPLGKPYVIHEQEGIRVGLLGVTTAYIPHWEVVEHIEGLTFLSALEAVEQYLPTLRPLVDVVIVLYHGGIERDLSTLEPIGRSTIENEGVALSQLDGVDVVLSGHQHMVIQHHSLLQPGFEGAYVGCVSIGKDDETVELTTSIILNDAAIDEQFESIFEPLQQETSAWLDQSVGFADQDFRVLSPLSVRANPHPLVSWIHQLQFMQTKADISVVSLPNDIRGFQGAITNRDLVNAFVYANTLCVVEMTGEAIKKAMEQSAAYFTIENETLTISKAFLEPKVEHYNYDMYAGVTYEIDVRQSVGERIQHLMFQGNPLDEKRTYKVVVNNYRASGGGDYEMFQQARLLEEHDVTLLTLSTKYVREHASLHVPLTPTFLLRW